MAKSAPKLRSVPTGSGREISKGEASRQQILDVCAKILNSGQFPKASMREIAKQAGIALGGLYFHFKSKEDLIDALMERGIRLVYEQVRDALASVPHDASSAKKLETALNAHLMGALTVTEHTLALRYLHKKEKTSEGSTEYFHIRDVHREMWIGLISKAQADGTLRPDTPAMLIYLYILGAVSWVPEWFDKDTMSTERIAHFFSHFFFEGVGTTDLRQKISSRSINSSIFDSDPL